MWLWYGMADIYIKAQEIKPANHLNTLQLQVTNGCPKTHANPGGV